MKSEDIIYCSRCGSELNKNARYCIKCGNINYSHPENQNMKKFEKKNQEYIYQVGQGQIINSKDSRGVIFNPSNTGNQKLCYLFNSLIFVLVLVIYALIILMGSNFIFDEFVKSSFSVVCIIFSIIYLYVASLEIIFMKTNNPWWAALIPFYNIWIFSKITLKDPRLAILYLIPGVNVVLYLYSMYNLGKKFGSNPKLTVIFFFLYLPIIAFKQNSFNNKLYLDSSDNSIIEKDYRRRHSLLFLIIIFLLFGIVLLGIKNADLIKSKINDVLTQRYAVTADKILDKVQISVKDKKYSCGDGYEFEANKNYYFYSTEAYNDYDIVNIKSLFGNEAEVLIVVNVDNNKNPTYYIEMTDGDIGFEKTLESDLEKVEVKKHTMIDKNIIENENYASCSIISD